MKNESAPQGGAPESIFASQRKNQSEATRSVCHQQVLARAGALVTATTAVASGVFPPTQATFEAVTSLASSLYWDVWVAVSA